VAPWPPLGWPATPILAKVSHLLDRFEVTISNMYLTLNFNSNYIGIICVDPYQLNGIDPIYSFPREGSISFI
jgi:hypothetical protein